MNIRKCDTITTYFVDVTDDICAIVKVVNNERIYIEKVTIWFDSELESFEYYAKVKYQRKINDIHNIENEIEEFVLSRLDKMKVKLDEVVERYYPYKDIK